MAAKRNDGDPALAQTIAREEWQIRKRERANAVAKVTLLKLVPRPEGSPGPQLYEFKVDVRAPRLLDRQELDQLMGELEEAAKRFCADL